MLPEGHMKQLVVCVLAFWAATTTNASGQQSPVAKPDFKGTWTAIGPAPGIASFRIADDDGTGLKIFVSAPCTPNPCQWPPVKFWALRDATPRSVTMGTPPTQPSPERGFASWPGGRAAVIYFDGDQLVFDAYSAPEKQNERGQPLANYTVTRLKRG